MCTLVSVYNMQNFNFLLNPLIINMELVSTFEACLSDHLLRLFHSCKNFDKEAVKNGFLNNFCQKTCLMRDLSRLQSTRLLVPVHLFITLIKMV